MTAPNLGRPARVLTVAGSDSGGGAGLEADVKTIERLGGYAMVAVTAVTAQNTLGVQGVWYLPPEAVQAQISAVAQDLGVDAAKTGMLGTAELAHAAAQALSRLGPLPLVVDPVQTAKGGQSLLADAAWDVLRQELLPLATLVTPNWPEAQALSGRPVTSLDQAREAARAIADLGPRAVLVKGGHGSDPQVTDLLYADGAYIAFSHPRQVTRHTHGTGCTLSAAIATGLAQGLSLPQAVERAERFVQAAIAHAPGWGSGHGPLGHSGGQPPWT
jgi:hydroxymethylpyrimidine/phosphomethylpyrimidine kinase